ncbi:MAG: ribosome recycling factor [Desulfobacterales bacterium]
MIKELKKDSEIPEDDAFRAQAKIQNTTDDNIRIIDEIYKEKEKEILEF